MKKALGLCLFIVLSYNVVAQQSLEKLVINDEWISKIQKLAPEKTSVEGKKRKVLLFSLFTGFDHWVIPHTAAVIKILGEKSGAFEVTETTDIQHFTKSSLKKYDLIVLNNTCSIREHRNIFRDVLAKSKDLSEAELVKAAAEYEDNLFRYVRAGGGLVVLHGGITMQNNTPEFGKMVGGSFDYHPAQQQFEVHLVDAAHPLVAAFEGQSFQHIDEPYVFSNAYFDFNFKPLLYMDPTKIVGLRNTADTRPHYISWIKRHGKGRVFYCSPSHNAQSYDNSKLLKFLLDGMQYAAGDLKCDDSPIAK